ncbi:HPP family protein [Kribbella sp. NPDC048928]|uniref:CBS domain-containing protein n=1 Tax=Kribbella sp. NPDC048928 TaxID=3364111 RepID=UPI00371D3464
MTVRVRDVMTTPAVTATEHDTIGEIVRLLLDEQAGSAPVVDERGAPVGTISLDVTAVRPDDDVATVAEMMRSTRTTILPVVDERRVVGTVTLDCLVAALRDDPASDSHHRRLADASAGTARPKEHP